MDQGSAGGRRHVRDERLPDHQFLVDAGRPAWIDAAATQFRQSRQLRRFRQFWRSAGSVGRRQQRRRRLGGPFVAHWNRFEHQFPEPVRQ
jgi:hypothetical protein